eukprot:scpid67825/ scgid11262/ 
MADSVRPPHGSTQPRQLSDTATGRTALDQPVQQGHRGNDHGTAGAAALGTGSVDEAVLATAKMTVPDSASDNQRGKSKAGKNSPAPASTPALSVDGDNTEENDDGQARQRQQQQRPPSVDQAPVMPSSAAGAGGSSWDAAAAAAAMAGATAGGARDDWHTLALHIGLQSKHLAHKTWPIILSHYKIPISARFLTSLPPIILSPPYPLPAKLTSAAAAAASGIKPKSPSKSSSSPAAAAATAAALAPA